MDCGNFVDKKLINKVLEQPITILHDYSHNNSQINNMADTNSTQIGLSTDPQIDSQQRPQIDDQQSPQIDNQQSSQADDQQNPQVDDQSPQIDNQCCPMSKIDPEMNIIDVFQHLKSDSELRDELFNAVCECNHLNAKSTFNDLLGYALYKNIIDTDCFLDTNCTIDKYLQGILAHNVRCKNIKSLEMLFNRYVKSEQNTRIISHQFRLCFTDNFDTDMIKLFISAGAKIEDLDKNFEYTSYKNALDYCIFNNMEHQIKYLAENGYDVDHEKSGHDAGLRYALCNNRPNAAKILVPYCKYFYRYGDESDLEYCIKNNLIDIAKLIVQNKNLIINGQNSTGKTALMLCFEKGNVDFAKMLIEAGADINIVANNNMTCMLIAMANGNADLVKLALDNKAKTNIQDDNGNTMLMNAVSLKKLAIVKLLAKDQIKINYQNYNGETALHIACRLKLRDIIQVLLDSGADTNIKNCGGSMACDFVTYDVELSALLNKYKKPDCKKLVDDRGNVYDAVPDTVIYAKAICEKNDLDTFPSVTNITCPVGSIAFYLYNEKDTKWMPLQDYHFDKCVEIQYVDSQFLKFHVIETASGIKKVRFDQIMLPTGETYKFKYY